MFLPEKLAEVFSDDIYLSYSLLAQILPEIRQMDRNGYRNLLMDSNLVNMLLYRSSN